MADQNTEVVKTDKELRKAANASIDNFRYLKFPTDRSGRLGAIKDAVKEMATINNRDSASDMIEALTTMAAWVARSYKSSVKSAAAKAVVSAEQNRVRRVASAKESIRAANDMAKQADADAQAALTVRHRAEAELEAANAAS